MIKKSFQEYKNDLVKYKLSLLNELNNPRLEKSYQYANGCGAESAFFDYVPDTNYTVDVSSACHNHDIKWKRAKSYDDLIKANKEFKEDLDKIVTKESNRFMLWFRLRRNIKYFLAVKHLGTDNYADERGFNRRGIPVNNINI